MSSALRQLIVFHTDLHRFVTNLRFQLGPQLQNVSLLYEGVPELKDILSLFDIEMDTPREELETHELRARLEALVESVFAVLAETRSRTSCLTSSFLTLISAFLRPCRSVSA